MAKNNFAIGLGLGILAGIAGKIIYDNKEDLTVMINEKSSAAAEELSTFANYAGEKVDEYSKVMKNTAQGISEKTLQKAKEIKDKAQQQYEEIKKAFLEAAQEVSRDMSEMAAGEEAEDEIIVTVEEE